MNITPLVKKSTLACALILAVSTTPVMAQQSSQISVPMKTVAEKDNENIGFGTGAVIGVLVAGPIGAMVTGLIGLATAKHINLTDQRDELTVQLNQQQTSHQIALEKYQQKIQYAEQAYHAELLALQQKQNIEQLQAENLLMSLQFSTGSSELKPHYLSQIQALANILEQASHLNIDLSGYTDLQGSDELNHALSIARVKTVKDALIDQGIEAGRINLFAFGEKAPVVANNEKQASFYDRRVVIKLQHNNSQKADQQTVGNY